MPIDLTCPHCRAKNRVRDHDAGKTGPCAECGQTIALPHESMITVLPPRTSPVTIVLGIAVSGFLACGGVVAALLVPALQMKYDIAGVDVCQNHLQRIAHALQTYHYAYGTFPAPYLADEKGQPLHSWRVAILPFLELEAIYRQYRFDEPWDGPHNRQLAAKYPTLPLYRCPEDTQSNPSAPSYMVVVAPDGVFEAGRWNSHDDIADDPSNTIVVVEVVGAASHWMAPVDLDEKALEQQINAARDGTGIASNHARGVNVAFADGSVRTLTSETDLQTLRRLITKSDGEPVNLP